MLGRNLPREIVSRDRRKAMLARFADAQIVKTKRQGDRVYRCANAMAFHAWPCWLGLRCPHCDERGGATQSSVFLADRGPLGDLT